MLAVGDAAYDFVFAVRRVEAQHVVSVPWEKLSEPQYADLVSRLLVRLHPRAEVIDGSGGDGGRDVQVRHAGRLSIYELKSFTGRLGSRSPNRRSQVEKSLARAATLNPLAWYLVVPINHNPAELQWFAELKKTYRFIRQWHGCSWLNTQLAAHPDLVRAVLRDVDGELLEAIREHRAERDMLAGGVPDLVARVEALGRRAEEISADYQVQAIPADGWTEVTISARPGAKAPPITVRGEFNFPATPEGEQTRQQVDEALAYGGDLDLSGQFVGPLTVNAPAELGISGTRQVTRLFMTAVPERLTPPLLATLTVLSPAGMPQQGLEIVFTQRLHGQRGFTLRGSDALNVLTVQLRVDELRRTGTITVSVAQAPLSTPSAALPLLRLLAAFVPPNLIRLHVNGDSTTLAETPIDEPLSDAAPQQVVQLVEQLATIQEHTRCVFAVPSTVTAEDAAVIRRAARLIAGEQVPIADREASFTFQPHDPTRLTQQFTGEFRLMHVLPRTMIRIAGRELDLGPSITYIPRCHLAQGVELAQPRADGGVTVTVELPTGESVYRYLGSHPVLETEQNGSARDARGRVLVASIDALASEHPTSGR
ncbi:hypothetical protein [Micromonospora sp. WMMD710]|uniref:hypothetical protein n=1 Tax=Micromonospora sp. WMMD710 TaxID=3016085 RepID=UPI002416D792|nr:hypothetical protein [Micromonospora sp. WMMD710]MDG4761124.1 hypothetical protein [Micromonospora sp. WMMD710]